MYVTSRWVAAVGAGVVLAMLGVLADQPLLLVAVAGIGAWLLAVAGYAYREFTHVPAAYDIVYEISETDTLVDAVASLTLAVQRGERSAAVFCTVEADMPVGVSEIGGNRWIELDSKETEKATSFTVEFPIAGRFKFPQPSLRVRDPFGLYGQRVQLGDRPAVTVRPKTPELHIGQGGDGMRSAYGRHETDQPGAGVTAREIRKYIPGDDVQQIDWKATARLGQTYIRVNEGETDRQIVLVFDHRDRMDTGQNGQTMLDYAREVGLGLSRASDELNDPIGLRSIGKRGITTAVDPSTKVNTYAQVETSLYDAKPAGERVTSGQRSASKARRISERLDRSENAFARILNAYVKDPQPYVQRLRDDPLVETIRGIRNQFARGTWIAVITSDDDPARLREAMKIATSGGSHVLVFITPRCLFEPVGMTDLDTTYERYLEFEELRRELDSHPRVTALEVAPGDRVDALLAHRQAKRMEAQ